MRGKIIAVFALVVLVVGGLSYALTRATLGDGTSPRDAQRAHTAASDELQLDALELERWLAARGTEPLARGPFEIGTADARSSEATDAANKLREAAASEFAQMSLALVVLVDKNGVVVGRNGSALLRGDDLGAVYPALKKALEKGVTGSDVWVNRKRNEQYLASYAPVRDAQGQVIGGIAIGTNINDERLANVSDKTSGRILIAAVKGEGDTGLDVVAKSGDASSEVVAAIQTSKETAQALASGVAIEPENLPREYTGSARDLEGYGDGKRLVLVSLVRSQAGTMVAALLWPALGATLLGLILVIAAGIFLGAYIQRPISELEDGLLAIMNGRTDLRFQIEHAELGGLVFRLNSLLNQLFGIAEDDTDSEGRPSRAPTGAGFQEALAVDERMVASTDVADQAALRAEPDAVYYDRIFNEYIGAKREIGDPVDHITKDAFIGRIQASEQETAAKHGKPVRYKVEVRGREVVLLAVPLA